mmetsp:Transcript_10695/g.18607  ORF Transcript_10695/g.18607 Transcript_10695/m.18607 type:complete len:234 (-) Transcript_10695:165-866(-)
MTTTPSLPGSIKCFKRFSVAHSLTAALIAATLPGALWWPWPVITLSSTPSADCSRCSASTCLASLSMASSTNKPCRSIVNSLRTPKLLALYACELACVRQRLASSPNSLAILLKFAACLPSPALYADEAMEKKALRASKSIWALCRAVAAEDCRRILCGSTTRPYLSTTRALGAPPGRSLVTTCQPPGCEVRLDPTSRGETGAAKMLKGGVDVPLGVPGVVPGPDTRPSKLPH